jgi:ribosome biogenesis GTPase
VAAVHRELYRVLTERGEFDAKVSGRFRHLADDPSSFPCVGDWVSVSLSPAGDLLTLHQLLPRRSRFSRKVPGVTAQEQVLAANVETVFLVSALDGDFNPRRIERYLSRAYDSGAAPVILLTKPDLCSDPSARRSEMEAAAPGVPVLVVGPLTGEGLEGLEAHLVPGKTAVLLGSSGVGKSTLLNRLLGSAAQETGEVREDDSRGRHTTTHREMFLLPNGAWLIDNPGLREFQLWDTEEGVETVFADILAHEGNCRFRDCRHESEPGCGVLAAVGAGAIPAARWESFLKLRKEQAYLARRTDQKAAQEFKKKAKGLRVFQKKKPKKGMS